MASTESDGSDDPRDEWTSQASVVSYGHMCQEGAGEGVHDPFLSVAKDQMLEP